MFNSIDSSGTWDWLEYDFTVPSTNLQLIDRANVRAAFANTATDYNGKSIAIEKWISWIPDTGRSSAFTAIVAPKTDNKEKRLMRSRYVHGRIEHVTIQVPKALINQAPSRDNGPQLLKWALPTTPEFAGANDPAKWPQHERRGFSTIDQFVDGFDWYSGLTGPWISKLSADEKAKVEEEEKKANAIAWRGYRRLYKCRLPIMDENDHLLFNYASATETRDVLEQQIDNSGLFGTAPPPPP
jgi:hypothetical protein